MQSVSAYADAASAVRAVARPPTGWSAAASPGDRDPRLGEASELLTRTGDDGTEQVVAGARVRGRRAGAGASGSAAEPGTWDSLADLALGSSCAAAEHGCH